MKILLIDIGFHFKNKNALLKYKNIEVVSCSSVQDLDRYNLSEFDFVYSPSRAIDVSKYPDTNFIFGPHFSVFPVQRDMQIITGRNSIYIQPSKWVSDMWVNKPLCRNIKICDIPFGVETDKFNSNIQIVDRTEVFLYYKRRQPVELKYVEDFLKNKGIQFKIFNYTAHYDENQYIECLKKAKYGIWIDAHESQGFALEEALSCNVPLLVWNVKSMNQEHGYSYPDIPATTIPYWDNRCGEYFYENHEFSNIFDKFISNLDKNVYKPREFVLENLSLEVCEKIFIDLKNKF